MDQTFLNFEARQKTKKGPSRQLRRQGKIPSVIYGQNQPETISVDEHEFSTKFKVVSESTIITLKSGDRTCEVLVKDFQEDILIILLNHVDNISTGLLDDNCLQGLLCRL